VPAYTAPTPASFHLEPDPNAKYRMTFIILGVLLGPFGAHNFYAGYKGKALAQLLITLCTLGFAGPMTWVWAVIDVCTVDKDSEGIQFRS
jgi:TM2 domain-containing membrane protein YozV